MSSPGAQRHVPRPAECRAVGMPPSSNHECPVILHPGMSYQSHVAPHRIQELTGTWHGSLPHQPIDVWSYLAELEVDGGRMSGSHVSGPGMSMDLFGPDDYQTSSLGTILPSYRWLSLFACLEKGRVSGNN
ncbi:hypothetical protein Bbelb_047710 [Branchiostoma belcheri]|nr:hypothetical protein Bbelb_047710 [Branchiostoma belcheri]